MSPQRRGVNGGRFGAGVYRSDELDESYALQAAGGKLVLRRKGLPGDELEPAYRDTFMLTEADEIGSRSTRLNFRRAADGAVTGLGVTRGRVIDLEFVRDDSR